MAEMLRLLAVLAHPDDESMGFGGALAKYAAEGVETFLVTATRGQRGRYKGHRDGPDYPGPEALGRIREAELRAAAATLGVREVSVLDYGDQQVDAASPAELVAVVAAHICRIRPQVVMTFGPDGVYGHPDHIAISQATTAAVASAARPGGEAAPHAVSKLYHMAWSQGTADAYLEAFPSLGSTVDGVRRAAVVWPEWMLTTRVDARAHWRTVWSAVCCHQSQVASWDHLQRLPDAVHEVLWGVPWFYRVFSVVNGGRARETDLFEGLRG